MNTLKEKIEEILDRFSYWIQPDCDMKAFKLALASLALIPVPLEDDREIAEKLVAQEGEPCEHSPEILGTAVESCFECRVKIITRALASKGQAVRDWCAMIASRRMTYWTKEDDKRTQDFREGIEQACSDIAKAIREGRGK